MSSWYILKDGIPKKASIDEYCAWTKTHPELKRVAETFIGPVRVSTVFLGLDHSWDGPPPLVFETMVFEGPWDMECERYSTLIKAKEGHEAMCRRITGPKPK